MNAKAQYTTLHHLRNNERTRHHFPLQFFCPVGTIDHLDLPHARVAPCMHISKTGSRLDLEGGRAKAELLMSSGIVGVQQLDGLLLLAHGVEVLVRHGFLGCESFL